MEDLKEWHEARKVRLQKKIEWFEKRKGHPVHITKNRISYFMDLCREDWNYITEDGDTTHIYYDKETERNMQLESLARECFGIESIDDSTHHNAKYQHYHFQGV